MKIVGIGGGTGLPVLLRGLREVLEQQGAPEAETGEALSAIVCVSDNGGSSGALRQILGTPAVGDLRNCLLALATVKPWMREMFQHRFNGASGLSGHCLGNLILATLQGRSGSLTTAVTSASEMLGSLGRVLPSTELVATVCAEFDDGSVERGETQIVAQRKRIRRIWLEPDQPAAAPGVIETIEQADAIVLGPGSLYTSILPNLLAAGVSEAIRRSRAAKILVCNLMTEPGETDDFTATDHLCAIEQYLGPQVIDVCVLNSSEISRRHQPRYAGNGSVPVIFDREELANRGVVPVCTDLLAADGPHVRHDPLKLARLIVILTRAAIRTREFAHGDLDLVA